MPIFYKKLYCALLVCNHEVHYKPCWDCKDTPWAEHKNRMFPEQTGDFGIRGARMSVLARRAQD